MGVIRRVLFAILPRRAREAIGRESRAWHLVCPHCGHARSVWSMGGIRYGAAGGKRVRLPCPACEKRGWHRFEKRGAG